MRGLAARSHCLRFRMACLSICRCVRIRTMRALPVLVRHCPVQCEEMMQAGNVKGCKKRYVSVSKLHRAVNPTLDAALQACNLKPDAEQVLPLHRPLLHALLPRVACALPPV